MMADEPHIRAVPNPPEDKKTETKELIKTVALTSAISSLVGVFAVAGGQAVYSLLKKAVTRKPAAPEPREAAPPPPVGAPPPRSAAYGPPPEEYDEMPEALRMRPHLRHPGRRKKGPSDTERIMAMFREFEQRQDERMRRLEERIDEAYEEDDEEDAA